MTLIQLDLPQDMKEEILKKGKIKNLRTKIYLMITTLDLNLMESNNEEAYNQEKDYSEMLYYKLNKIDNLVYENKRENGNYEINDIYHENNGDFENLYNK